MNQLPTQETILAYYISTMEPSQYCKFIENEKNIPDFFVEKKITYDFQINEELAKFALSNGEFINSVENIKCELEKNAQTCNLKCFKCTFENCKRSFDFKWILDRHINSHFCFKLYNCEFANCNKAYKSKENLNLHVKNKHLGEKPYQCRFCLLRFSHRNGKNFAFFKL
jgi:hypothetical protein